MKVLSLFDGMSCGRIALDQLGIPVEKYYASEKHTTEKCFYLVKDDGIYLMNAYSTPKDKTPKTNNTVVYASGYNPKYNDNVWEDSYQVSRDDFADNMYFTDDQLERIAGGGDIDITITPDSYEVRA